MFFAVALLANRLIWTVDLSVYLFITQTYSFGSSSAHCSCSLFFYDKMKEKIQHIHQEMKYVVPCEREQFYSLVKVEPTIALKWCCKLVWAHVQERCLAGLSLCPAGLISPLVRLQILALTQAVGRYGSFHYHRYYDCNFFFFFFFSSDITGTHQEKSVMNTCQVTCSKPNEMIKLIRFPIPPGGTPDNESLRKPNKHQILITCINTAYVHAWQLSPALFFFYSLPRYSFELPISRLLQMIAELVPMDPILIQPKYWPLPILVLLLLPSLHSPLLLFSFYFSISCEVEKNHPDSDGHDTAIFKTMCYPLFPICVNLCIFCYQTSDCSFLVQCPDHANWSCLCSGSSSKRNQYDLKLHQRVVSLYATNQVRIMHLVVL
ncbi:hypothetical protein VP01_498g2 [Puccinia sorghi]|uniref:Uncharacterized protein n=1 Tax=Puccinia sorghi TaxID=27349 RepID=A0A0L6UNT2_9BASI|nr:hypothetical protein VP01_498g2 [Puccinia sorghi]